MPEPRSWGREVDLPHGVAERELLHLGQIVTAERLVRPLLLDRLLAHASSSGRMADQGCRRGEQELGYCGRYRWPGRCCETEPCQGGEALVEGGHGASWLPNTREHEGGDDRAD